MWIRSWFRFSREYPKKAVEVTVDGSWPPARCIGHAGSGMESLERLRISLTA